MLDVTRQREIAVKAELLEISRKIVAARHKVLRIETMLSSLLSELAEMKFEERMKKQEVFLKHSSTSENEIKKLKQELKQLEHERNIKRNEFVKVKAKRETLERLCEEARQAHMREQVKIEQQQLDESAHLAFARRAAERTVKSGR